MTKPESTLRDRAGLAAVILVLVVFIGHRLLVLLSAGDFLYPLEPSEAKNTQLAWDLMTGRFGQEGFGLGDYVANTGSIHHGSYSSAALAYLASSSVLGHGILALRAVPLLATSGALLVWMLLIRRHLGAAAASLAGLGLWLVPTLFIGFQLTFLGCHPESVLPLAATIAAWLHWSDGRTADPRASLLIGACLGYSAIFSYLLWPLLAFMVALSFVPPLPRPSAASLRAAAIGLLVGLWPLWVIVLAGDVDTLLFSAITEREETTIANTVRGAGVTAQLLEQTFWTNLPYGFDDYWSSDSEVATTLGLNYYFEQVAYRGLVFGPLLLLPYAIFERNPVARRLALLVALAPATVYAWLAFATPWKPFIPQRYFIPLAFLGLSAPGIALGLALSRWRSGDRTRWLAIPLLLLLLGWVQLIGPKRFTEARVNVQLDRAAANLDHRYVDYYNLGFGTVWASQVADVNEFIDVVSAEGDPQTFQGMQPAMWGGGRRLALGHQDWDPPTLEWGHLRAGLSEWRERQGYTEPAQRDDPLRVAYNVGWGAGIRSGWRVDLLAGLIDEGVQAGEWPDQLPLERFWEGFGFGAARSGQPSAPSLGSGPPGWAESIEAGFRAGQALGAVPRAPDVPVFQSVRGPAT